jgi:hypothetical protein
MIKSHKSSRWNTSFFFGTVLLVVLAFCLPQPAGAQGETEPDEEFEKLGKLYAELEAWAVQPIGTDFKPTSLRDPNDIFNTRILGIDPSTENRFRVRGGFRLKDNIGEFLVTYASMNHLDSLSRLSPGDFIYGILLPSQRYSGIFNDGWADGFSSEGVLKTRDLRIDFYREAFKGRRLSSKWFVGYRRVLHDRALDATYYALAPDLPNLLNPISGESDQLLFQRLLPRADVASLISSYNGRGLETGMTVKLDIGSSRKVWAEADFAAAILRGKIDTEYYSITHRYIMRDSGGNFMYELAPPYDEFGEFENPNDPESLPVADRIFQQNLRAGLKSSSDPGASFLMEMSVSLRWRVWRNLDLFGGFRQTYYGNIGMDLRPRTVAPAGNEVSEGVTLVVNSQDASRELKSVTYEGFFFGVAYTY